MNGEGAVVAESRPRKRTNTRRSSAEVASASEMRMTAEMPPTTTAEVGMAATAMEMSAAAMTATTVAAATMTAAAFRRGTSGG